MEKTMLHRYSLLDNQTGENKVLVELTPHHSIIHKNSSKSFKEKARVEKLKQQGRGKKWVACYHEPIKEKTKNLTLTECGVIMKLLPYLQFQGEGMLIQNREAMKLKDIQAVIGKSKPATIATLDTLEKEGVVFKIKKGKSNVYYINSTIHSIGEVLKDVLFTKLYQGKTKELLDKINLHEAGVLYKILPYFHYKNYYLCKNPNEEAEEKIHYLSREELALIIGHDEKTLYRNMTMLCNQGVLMKKQANKKVRFIIHPDLMFRREYESEEAEFVRKDFERFQK